ncbi:MAG: HD domain-containing protein [Lachnospiraceae bacterium]|nr:HD domain-containing protein [Lachnospiraceae bacterium]
MLFVKTGELKTGMRLARPIYNNKGVLLFERNSLLTAQAIDSVKNFGLLGIYILEPAEPLPPMSEEDLEYERFQMVTVAVMKEELEKIISSKHAPKMQVIANNIISKYGHLENKIQFYQNLRSKEDYVCRHSLNVAILCAMISNVMNLKLEERMQTVIAAIVHDIVKLQNPGINIFDDNLFEVEKEKIYELKNEGSKMIEEAFAADGAMLKRICMQALRARMDAGKPEAAGRKLVTGAKILMVADRYDEMTAMSLEGKTESEVAAIKEFMDHPEVYDPEVVDALIKSILILFPGVSVELNTGEKALVLSENPRNVLRPVVLCFKDNSILDLSIAENRDIEIVDIMKTMDNRYIMANSDALNQLGIR